MPDNLEQVREQIKLLLGSYNSKIKAMREIWDASPNKLLIIDKILEGNDTFADSILSTPILERICPECGGRGNVYLNQLAKAILEGYTGEELEIENSFDCKSCSGTGKVPFTVGDAINKAIEELR